MHPFRLLVPSLATLVFGSCARAPQDAAVPSPPPPPADTNPIWMAHVTARIRDAAHGFVPEGASFAAEVPERRLSARFDWSGAHIHTDRERTPITPRSVGFGRISAGSTARALPLVSPELGDCQEGMADPQDNCIRRLEYASPGLTEWWASTSAGFEQGWDVLKRPEGTGRVEIEVQVDNAEATAHDAGLWLRGDDGGSLVVGRLAALDANGREVNAWFEARVEGFAVVFEDEGAVYPIEVDPVYTTASWTVEGSEGATPFGQVVSGAGDVNGDGYDDLLLGCYSTDSDSGRVYVYLGSALGVSTTASQALSPPASGATFGVALAAIGDVNDDGYDDVAVGALDSAYVFHGSASGLSETPDATLTGASSSDFGAELAGAGDVNGDGYDDLIVGASTYDSTEAGRAYVYLGASTGISASPATVIGGGSSDRLGCSVTGGSDLTGDGFDDVVVGAYGYSTGTGRVYVYPGSATGVSTTAATTLTGPTTRGDFGYALALGDVDGDGFDDLAVGMPEFSTSFVPGYVLVYSGSASGLSSSPTLTLAGPDTNGRFGEALAPAGDVNGDGYADFVIGEPEYLVDAGKAFVYTGSAAGLSASPSATFIGASGDSLGLALGGAGDTNGDGFDDVALGAPGFDSGDGVVGAMYLYQGDATATLSAHTDFEGAWDDIVGVSIAGAGDVNGDGYDDVIIGAYGYLGYTGEALIYHGSSAGLPAVATQTLYGSSVGDGFGYSIAAAGDTNGDGYDDVIIGAYGDGAYGAAFVYEGSATGVSATAGVTFTGNSSTEYLGHTVAGAGDVDGDGYADVAVAGDIDGAVLIFHGGPSGCSTTPARTLTLSDTISSVAGVGDVNGDGYDDIVIGCADDNGNTGRADLYNGSASGIFGGASATLTGGWINYYFGCSVAGAGDVNADGYDDVIIGAWGGRAETGNAYVYHGSFFGLSTTAASSLQGSAYPNYFGYSVAGARDVNGDGYDDVIVGAYGYGGTGAVYVYSGSATGVADPPTTTITGEQSLGTAVASAGDVNGDGLFDILAADAMYNSDAGAVSLYLGYVDDDGDGVPSFDDCDDADAAIGLPTTSRFADADGDGYGDASASAIVCDGTPGYVADALDCDDAAATINPGATELCDAADTDEDCDGLADDTDPSATGQSTFYADSDGDGYGGSGSGSYCDLPSGWVTDSTDCDDDAATINPGATETVANGADEDCDTGELCYVDTDFDGYRGSTTVVSTDADCSDPGEALSSALEDCDDSNETIHPGGVELAGDGIDEDCDGQELCFEDADDDGYRPDETTTVVSVDPDCADEGEATSEDPADDCDDADPTAHPGAVDVPGDGIDQDCDGADTPDTGTDSGSSHGGPPPGDDGAAPNNSKGCACTTTPDDGSLIGAASLAAALITRRRRAT